MMEDISIKEFNPYFNISLLITSTQTMAPSVNPAVYKKSSGYLTIDPETDEFFWQSSTSQPPVMKIQLSQISSKE